MPYPFTEAGAASLIADLYEMPEDDRALEAEAAKEDFRSWLKEKFEFSEDQTGYVDDMDSEWFAQAGDQFSFSLYHEFPITLIKPIVIDPKDFSSKIIRNDLVWGGSYNVGTGTVYQGSLTFALHVPE